VSQNVLFGASLPLVQVIFRYNPTISCYEILYWKSLSMILLNYIYIYFSNGSVLDIPIKYRIILMFRALVGFWGIQGYWSSAKYIPVSISGCLFGTCPLWVLIFGRIFLGEKISKCDFISIFFSFFGVIIVNDPLNYFHNEAEEQI